MLFDHDAKVSGDSARFADFLAAGDQQSWVVCVKDWAGYRSVTHPEARPGRTGLRRDTDHDAVLQRPAAGWPDVATSYDPVRQIAEDHAIGNVAADVGLLALVLERHLDGRPERAADTGLRDPQAWRSLPAVL